MELEWENKFIVPDNINSYLNLFGWPIRMKHGSFLVMGLSPYYLTDVTSGKLQKGTLFQLIQMEFKLEKLIRMYTYETQT